jgi:hypothetical protein
MLKKFFTFYCLQALIIGYIRLNFSGRCKQPKINTGERRFSLQAYWVSGVIVCKNKEATILLNLISVSSRQNSNKLL